MRRVITFAAGAALTVSGCNGAAHKANPQAAPDVETPTIIAEAEAEAEAAQEAPEPTDATEPTTIAEVADAPADANTLPTWDDVPSGHPAGATNPPIPTLVVTEDGRCFKQWLSPMARRGMILGDRVDTCEAENACGTAIQCPEERAQKVLDAHKSGD